MLYHLGRPALSLLLEGLEGNANSCPKPKQSQRAASSIQYTIRILQRKEGGRESLANALEVEKTSGPLVSHRYATPRWNGAAFLSYTPHVSQSEL